MTDPDSAKSIATLRRMSDDELIAAHDEMARRQRSVMEIADYRTELARRDADRQTRTMLYLTRWIAVLTVLNVGLVAYSVLH